MSQSEPIVLYDESCPLCKKLAGGITPYLPSSWSIMAWQTYARAHQLPLKADKLRVLVDDTMLEDREAWEFLFMNIPQLYRFSKLAKKLHFQRQSISIIRTSASLLRSWCRKCGS